MALTVSPDGGGALLWGGPRTADRCRLPSARGAGVSGAGGPVTAAPDGSTAPLQTAVDPNRTERPMPAERFTDGGAARMPGAAARLLALDPGTHRRPTV